MSLLSILLFVCFCFQFVSGALVYVDILPAESHLVKPSFAPLNIWQLTYTATGYGYSDLVLD